MKQKGKKGAKKKLTVPDRQANTEGQTSFFFFFFFFFFRTRISCNDLYIIEEMGEIC